MNRFGSNFQRMKWSTLFMVGALVAGCGGSGGGRDTILGSGNLATAKPVVTAVTPAANSLAVPANTKLITATFSKAMTPSTLTPASFTLACPGTVAMTGTTVTYAATGNLATLNLNPALDLPFNTLCTATVTTAAKDTSGFGLENNYAWNFKTGALTDIIAPMVTFTAPSPNATGVSTKTMVTANFTEPMDPATVTPATYTVKQGATAVPGSVSYSGTTAVFNPNATLLANTPYTATISTGAKDLAGNPLASNYVWNWTTAAAPDTTPPTVTSTGTPNGATGVPINRNSSAFFSEPMDPATVNTSTYTVKQGITAVAGSVSYSGTTATFNPSTSLAPNTTYTSTITTGANDLAGNALASNYVWSWTTAAASTPVPVLDTTPPTVIFTGVSNGTTGVPTNRNSTATFSEPMNAADLTTASYTVIDTTTSASVPGTVSYAGNIATFNPIASLANNTRYTSTIKNGVRDLAGNPLVNDYIWSWTTAAAPDTLAPTLTSTIPLNLATNVPVNQEVTAMFSEEMTPLTVNNTTFTLKQGLIPVVGTVNYVGTTATFTPKNPLLNNTTYTAEVTNLAKDLAGNGLVAGTVTNPWTFTTAAAIVPPPVGPALVNLDCAANFAILAGSTVTNTGPTIISNGDLGLSPGTALTGFPPGTLAGGAIHINDLLANNAKLCLTTAYNDAAGRTLAPITVAGNIGGQTLAPGLYKSTSTLSISGGDLTLAGPANAVWIFQVASTFTTTAGRQVILTGGALASNVFWQVGTSATLGTTSQFKGTILADQSITLETGAVLNGRALTRIGAVSLDSNAVVKP